MTSVLFLCTGNSCRSQMAEGFARHLHAGLPEPASAGIEQHGMNPRTVKVMAEVGVDITGQYSKTTDELGDRHFDVVVTVCDHAREVCPLWPAATRLVHRSFTDPAAADHLGGEEEILVVYRQVRDEIRGWIADLPKELSDHH